MRRDSGSKGENTGKKTMAHTMVGDIQVIVHREEPPSNEEWDTCLEETRRNAERVRGLLVFTLGGGPSALQRKKAREITNGVDLKAAILTSSVVVRGIVTAFHLFSSERYMQTFEPDDFEGAFRHLQVPPSGQEPLRKAVARLRQEIGC